METREAKRPVWADSRENASFVEDARLGAVGTEGAAGVDSTSGEARRARFEVGSSTDDMGRNVAAIFVSLHLSLLRSGAIVRGTGYAQVYFSIGCMSSSPERWIQKLLIRLFRVEREGVKYCAVYLAK